MREFVIRARQAPVKAAQFVAQVGGEGHVEILAQCLINALLISKQHRADTKVTFVLEGSQDYSRAVTFDGSSLGAIGGFHEAAVIELIAFALQAGEKLQKEEGVVAADGISVQAISFEHFVKDRAASVSLYMLARKGEDIRSTNLALDACFILTDHIPMPRKTFNTLSRLGAQKISLGPKVLFASQCITLIHGQLDRLH